MPSAQCLPAARHSVPSPDASLVATLQRTRLLIRSATTNELIKSWPVPQDFVAKTIFLRWSRSMSEDPVDSAARRRILVTDVQSVKIFDVDEPKWKASIDGAASNLGPISDVSFGHDFDDILICSGFGVKLTRWSLATSRGAEIKNPKIGDKNHDGRPRTGHLAVLTRPAAQDILMLMKPDLQEVIKSVELSTVDAQEVKWSRDGNWIAVRDASSMGHKVQIYTADGHLFKTFSGFEDSLDVDLGIKSMTWNPAGTLILGDYNGRVVLLRKSTFAPMIILQHKTPIDLPGIDVWEEQIKANAERAYARAPESASPPNSATFTKSNPPRQGVSLLALNHDGTMLATRDDAVPTTAWLWSMQTGKPVTVLIHHSPIKHLEWHLSQNDLLLVHCAIQEPLIHLWKSSWIMPLVVTLPMVQAKSKLETHWLQSSNEECFNILLSSQTQTIHARISLAGDLIPDDEEHETTFKTSEGAAEDMFDEGNSLDLSPIKFGNTEDLGFLGDSGTGFGFTEHGLDDTFHYRKQVRAGG